jgi:hypothetical protein
MENAVKDSGKTQTQGVVTQALKEWAIAITTLRSGALILLPRKGGIRDPLHPFAKIPQRVALFPTYEHQAPQYLQHPVEIVQTDPHGPIVIDTWAEVTHGFTLQTEAEVMALLPFHIWTEAFMTERLKWRSQQPLQVLLLRAYRLPEVVELGRSPSHAGCRSWIDLDTPISTQNSIPAMSDQDYQTRLQSIEQTIQAVTDDFKLDTFELSQKRAILLE